MGVGRILFQWGPIVDFSRWWPKAFFPGVATVVKFHFTNSKLIEKYFSTEQLVGKFQLKFRKDKADLLLPTSMASS